MADEVTKVDGEDRTVREDEAKSHRGTVWALISVAAFVVILAIVFFGFFLKSATDNKPNETPGKIEERRQP
jgi:flagellar basal body-associated protein FliL